MATEKLPQLEKKIIAHLTKKDTLDRDAMKLLQLIKEWGNGNEAVRSAKYKEIKTGYQFRCIRHTPSDVWNELHRIIKSVSDVIDKTEARSNLSACNPIQPTQAMIDEAAGRVSVEIVRSPTLAYDIYPLSYLKWFGSHYAKTLAT